MNQSYQPQQDLTNYMSQTKQQMYTELIKMHTILEQNISQNQSMVKEFFEMLRNEYTTTHTSPPIPKGTILYNINLHFMF